MGREKDRGWKWCCVDDKKTNMPIHAPQNIAHPPELLTESLDQLSTLLKDLAPFLDSPEMALHSVLLEESNGAASPCTAVASSAAAAAATPGEQGSPLLHRLVAVNAYMQLFVHLSRACQVGYNVSTSCVLATKKLLRYIHVHVHVQYTTCIVIVLLNLPI